MPGQNPSGLPDPTPKAVLALQATRIFAGLSTDLLQETARLAVVRRFDPDQVIFLEGDPPEALYILTSGWVKSIHLSREGREQALMFLQPGEVFGDIAVFTGRPYPATVVALEPVEAWMIRRSDMMNSLANSQELALAVIRGLSERILKFVDLVDDLALRNVEMRLAHTLLKHTKSVDGRLIVPRRPWTTFDEMAVRLGTVRDVLGRVLRGLENDGLLRIERDAILILDPEELARRGNR